MSKILISVVLGAILGNAIHFFLYTNQVISGQCYNGMRWGEVANIQLKIF